MDIINIVLRIESPSVGGQSIIFKNGIKLSQEEIDESEILYDLIEDENFHSVSVSTLDKCYKRTDPNGITTYISYGNLDDKDECDRYLAFSALCECKNAVDGILSELLSTEFQKVNYSFAKRTHPCQPNHYCISNNNHGTCDYLENQLNKKKSNRRIILLVILILIIIILILSL